MLHSTGWYMVTDFLHNLSILPSRSGSSTFTLYHITPQNSESLHYAVADA